MDDVPVEAFLDAFPPPIRAIAAELRGLVAEADPHLLERVRGGWALIGYDLAVGRRRIYLAFIAPERQHVHLGFQVGTLMRPRPELRGAHLRLKKVRFLTWLHGEAVDTRLVRDLLREAVTIARLPRAERALLAEERAQADDVRVEGPTARRR